MKTYSKTPVMVCFIVIGVIIGLTLISSRTHEMVETQAQISFILSSLGGVIAFLSAMMILFRAAGGVGIAELMPLVLSLLAGILVNNGHWAGVIALGVWGAAYIVIEGLRKNGTGGDDPNPYIS